MATRAHARVVCQNINGDKLAAAAVYVYQPGTTTPIVESLYLVNTGGSSTPNPLTADANGAASFYLDAPKRVDLRIVAGGVDVTVADVPVMPDAEVIVDLTTAQSVTNKTLNGPTNIASQAQVRLWNINGAAPTTAGDLQYDTGTNTLKMGNGSATDTMVNAERTQTISGAKTLSADLNLSGTANLLVAGGYLELSEISAPSAPASDKGRIYLVDNGSGKTLARAIFSSGAAQTFATQP